MKNITIVDSNPAKSMSPFFIVSTGRSGTKSIADYFTRCTNSICLHEPEPKLIAESSGYRYGNIPENDIHEILSRTRVKPVHDQIYGESNQTLSLIIPILRKAYPTSKFIWLVRNGLDVVASAAGRGWYTGSLFNKDYNSLSNLGKRWVDGRIEGNKCGAVSEKEWANMSAFAKCCWYWSYVNLTIEEDLKNFADNSFSLFIRLEDINKNIRSITDWLGLSIISSEPVQVLNRANNYSVYHHSNWTISEWSIFDKWCGSMMDRFYPEWREYSKEHRYISEAEYKSENNDLSNAERLLYKSLLINPKSARALNDLGVIHLTQNKLEQCYKYYSMAVDIEPNNLCYQMNLADFYFFKMASPQKALAIYYAIIKEDPQNIQALLNIAHICVSLGRFEDALQFNRMVLYLSPDDGVARNLFDAIRSKQQDCADATKANYLLKEKRVDFNTDFDELPTNPPSSLSELLIDRLNLYGWQSKLSLYQKYIESTNQYQSVIDPVISIVTISWRLHPDTVENFRRLQKERHLNFELIFVDNGGHPGEFTEIKPYIDTYIRLRHNTGAYLARNIGALFVNSPIIFFLEDDGLPADNLVASHLDAFKKYNVLSVRGVYHPKSERNPFNAIMAKHYYLGEKPFPHFVNLEGNASYDAAAFFSVGGWDDKIKFGHGGPELSYRLLQYDPDHAKQIYSPAPIIYHDYADNISHLKAKQDKQSKSMEILISKYPDFSDFLDSWYDWYRKTEKIALRNSVNNSCKIQSVISSKRVSTKDTPSVSIVIPTFNRSAYLKEALDSAINQTYPANEILVIDDASTDDTQKIIKSIEHDRVRYVRKEHSGAPSTRNRGIIESKADFILWLDDDDILMPDAIETHVELIKNNSEIDVIYGLLQNFDSKTGLEINKFNPIDWSIYPDMLCANMLKGCAIPNPGTMVRRSAYERLGAYDISFSRAHDYEFWTRSLKSLKFKKNYSIVCRYRIHSDNMSAGGLIDRSFESLIMRKMIHRYGLRKIYHWLNWEEPEIANAVALYMASENFLNIGDTHNALRLIEEIPAHLKSPDICDLHLKGLFHNGKTTEARRILNSLSVNAIINVDDLIVLKTNFNEYIEFHKTLNASFLKNDYRTTQKMLQKLDEEGRLIHADQIIAFCDHHKHTMPDKFLLKFLQSAIIQKPTCKKTLRQAVDLVNTQEAREALDITRRRVLDQIVEFTTSTKKPVKAKGLSPKRKNEFSKIPFQHHENILNIDENARRFYEMENYSAAIETLGRAIAQKPDHWEAYDLLVNVMQQSRQETAIPDQLRSLEGCSDLPARMLALIGSGYEATNNFERAEAFANQALALEPECARAWNLKGVVAYRNGLSPEAAQHFQKASECDQDYGDPFTNMGMLHWENGTHDMALECFETGFRLSPTSPHVATSYHVAVSETGQYHRAREVFEEVVARHPDFRKSRFLLIDILIRLEAYPAVLNHIEDVLVRFGPDSQLLEAAKVVRTKVGPMAIQTYNRPSLSLCMIVKNEEKYMARCLASLKPIVDEMIIVDTGSTDATHDIAEIFGARVIDYEWHDDFAAARNFSLEKASGDWILIMDADEVIAKNDHKIIRQLISKPKSKKQAYMVVTRNYTHDYNSVGWESNDGQYPLEEAGTGWISSEKVRLFPNKKNIRFEYPIHEVVGPSLNRNNFQLESCPVPIHHYGKLDIQKEKQKDEHYYKLGLEKLKSAPNDIVAIRELAIQAAKLDKLEDAIGFWNRLVELQPNDADSYINMAYIYSKLKKYNKAKAVALKSTKLAPKLKEGYFNLGICELHLNKPQKAENIFFKLTKNHKNYHSAVYMLGASQLCQGHIEKGIKTLHAFQEEQVWNDLHLSFQNLIESLMAAGCNNSAFNLADGTEALGCSNKKIEAYRRQLGNKAA